MHPLFWYTYISYFNLSLFIQWLISAIFKVMHKEIWQNKINKLVVKWFQNLGNFIPKYCRSNGDNINVKELIYKKLATWYHFLKMLKIIGDLEILV